MAAKTTKSSKKGSKASKKTTTKKVAASKKTKKKQSTQELKKALEQKMSSLPSMKPTMNKQMIIALVVVLVLGLAYIFRGLFIAALVNGNPVWRWEVVQQAEQSQGPSILDNLVLEELIMQKAKADGIVISDEAINTQIEEIKKNVTDQGQDFDQLLEAQGLTLDELKEQIRLQQLVETMAMSDSEVTDEEIDQFLEENADFLPEDSTEEELRDLAKQQLEQQKMSTQYQQWIQDIKTEANIQYMVDYAMDAQVVAQ